MRLNTALQGCLQGARAEHSKRSAVAVSSPGTAALLDLLCKLQASLAASTAAQPAADPTAAPATACAAGPAALAQGLLSGLQQHQQPALTSMAALAGMGFPALVPVLAADGSVVLAPFALPQLLAGQQHALMATQQQQQQQKEDPHVTASPPVPTAARGAPESPQIASAQ
jgi:hypothetical protein